MSDKAVTEPQMAERDVITCTMEPGATPRIHVYVNGSEVGTTKTLVTIRDSDKLRDPEQRAVAGLACLYALLSAADDEETG